MVNNVLNGEVWIGTGTFTDGVPENKFSHILPEKRQTLQSFCTVPRGHIGQIYSVYVEAASSKELVWELHATQRGFLSRVIWQGNIVGGARRINFEFPIKVPELTDIDLRVKYANGTGNVDGSFNILYNKYNQHNQ